MALTEFAVKHGPNAQPENIISHTSDGWYFGQTKPNFEYAKILFDQDAGVVKLVPVDTKEHLGVGHVVMNTRNGRSTYTLRAIRFARSGIAPRGKYKQVEDESNTYRFFQPSSRPSGYRNAKTSTGKNMSGIIRKKKGYVAPRQKFKG